MDPVKLAKALALLDGWFLDKVATNWDALHPNEPSPYVVVPREVAEEWLTMRNSPKRLYTREDVWKVEDDLDTALTTALGKKD